MTTSESVNSSCFESPAGFIQQGDVFRVGLVTPYTDTEHRVFRTTDGRHGSVVIAGSAEGKVFSSGALIDLLASSPQDPLRVPPFCETPDGQKEFVIVNADCFSYFVVISQTCDVSGVHKDPLPCAVVLGAKTTRELCRTERLPFQGEEYPRTIHEYIVEKSGDTSLERADDLGYIEHVRRLFQSWKPTDNNVKANRGRIKNFLKDMSRGAGGMYYLQDDIGRAQPGLHIYFWATFTVLRNRLVTLLENRTATLVDLHRVTFAKAFADHVSRIALPRPMSLIEV